MNKDERNAHRQGQQAFNDGVPGYENPYLFSQQRTLHDAWDSGHSDEMDRAI